MIRVGVAGWDYPDWSGAVYPSRAPRGFDRLAHLARFVDAVEVNTTFYRPVDPHRASAWVRRTEGAPDFRFTAKAHRSWTHEPGADLSTVVPDTLTGLAPLREARVLGALLLQFPQSFHRSPAALERVDRLLERLDGWPVVVEVRHASWGDPSVEAWFRERGVGLAAVDQPRIGGSTLEPRIVATSDVLYLRLHGRNAPAWFREGAGRDERYDWLYAEDELAPLARGIRGAAPSAAEAFVIQNNHFRGKALANALMMKHLLGIERPDAPEELVDAYPELASIVTTRRRRLF